MRTRSDHSCRSIRAAFLGLSALLFSACGGGSDGASSNPPTAGPPAPAGPASTALTVSVTAPTTALPHGLPTPITLAVSPAQASLSCAAIDPVALEVSPDCRTVTAWRLGSQQIRVTGPADAAGVAPAGLAAVRVIPQRRWAGLSPDGLSASTLLVATPDGRALAWGANRVGLLGAGLADVTALQALPAPVLALDGGQPLAGIVQTQLAATAALALNEAGQVMAWGESRYTASGERAGRRTAAVPVQRSAAGDRLAGVVQIAGADGALAAVLEDSAVLGWGAHSGTGTDGLVDYPTPVLDEAGRPLTGIRSVVGGWSAIAALGADGRVWVWGFGMAPDGGRQLTARLLRTASGAELGGIVSLAAGNGHLLALDASGQVYAAGANDAGQLGQGDISPVPGWAAVAVRDAAGTAPLGDIAMVAAGARVSLALDLQGRVWSWGNSNWPTIGCGIRRCNTAGNYRPLPGPVVGPDGTGQLAGIVSIKTSYDHALALSADGTVLVWGAGGAGLGQGSPEAPEAWSPIAVRDSLGTGALVLHPAAYPNLQERFR